MALNRIVSNMDEDLIESIKAYSAKEAIDIFDFALAQLVRLGLSSGTATPVLSDAVTAEIAEFAAGNGISYDLALAHVVANGLHRLHMEEIKTL